MILDIKKEIGERSDLEKAKNLSRFFKTGKGEYGEGDTFVGLTVPESRGIAKKYYKEINFEDLKKLISSKVHEERLIALEILVFIFENNNERQRGVFDFYMHNIKFVNNWDLVDLSAPYILGEFLLDKDRSVLYKLANSDNLWERRISIVSTWTFIKKSDFKDVIKISEILLKDKHDLIHKAVGWMLREMGKRDVKILEEFLKKHYKEMPRTMLRYSIEKFEKEKRKKYLLGTI